jgi:hypothetical protein
MATDFPDGVYVRGTRLSIRYTIRSHKYREPVETRDPRAAAQIRRRRIEQHERGERTRDSGKLRVAAVLDAVLRDYEINGRRSIRTATGHVGALTARSVAGSPPNSRPTTWNGCNSDGNAPG